MKFRALNFDYHAEASLRLLEDSENEYCTVIHILPTIEKDEKDENGDTQQTSKTSFFRPRDEQAPTDQQHGGHRDLSKQKEYISDERDVRQARDDSGNHKIPSDNMDIEKDETTLMDWEDEPKPPPKQPFEDANVNLLTQAELARLWKSIYHSTTIKRLSNEPWHESIRLRSRPPTVPPIPLFQEVRVRCNSNLHFHPRAIDGPWQLGSQKMEAVISRLGNPMNLRYQPEAVAKPPDDASSYSFNLLETLQGNAGHFGPKRLGSSWPETLKIERSAIVPYRKYSSIPIAYQALIQLAMAALHYNIPIPGSSANLHPEQGSPTTRKDDRVFEPSQDGSFDVSDTIKLPTKRSSPDARPTESKKRTKKLFVDSINQSHVSFTDFVETLEPSHQFTDQVDENRPSTSEPAAPADEVPERPPKRHRKSAKTDRKERKKARKKEKKREKKRKRSKSRETDLKAETKRRAVTAGGHRKLFSQRSGALEGSTDENGGPALEKAACWSSIDQELNKARKSLKKTRDIRTPLQPSHQTLFRATVASGQNRLTSTTTSRAGIRHPSHMASSHTYGEENFVDFNDPPLSQAMQRSTKEYIEQGPPLRMETTITNLEKAIDPPEVDPTLSTSAPSNERDASRTAKNQNLSAEQSDAGRPANEAPVRDIQNVAPLRRIHAAKAKGTQMHCGLSPSNVLRRHRESLSDSKTRAAEQPKVLAPSRETPHQSKFIHIAKTTTHESDNVAGGAGRTGEEHRENNSSQTSTPMQHAQHSSVDRHGKTNESHEGTALSNASIRQSQYPSSYASAPSLKLLCSEAFFETWGHVVGELASGKWSNSFHEDENNPVTVAQGKRIELFDTSLVDKCGVDIELPSRCGILVYTASALEDERDAKDIVLGLAQLAAIGRYKQIYILIVYDVEANNVISRHILQLQTAAIRHGGAPPSSTHFKTVSPSSLSAGIAETTINQARSTPRGALVSVTDILTDDRVRERASFLLSIVPTLSASGAIQCLQMSTSQGGSGPNGLMFGQLFHSPRLRQQIMLAATASPSKAAEIHPHVMIQLAQAHRVFLGKSPATTA